MGCLLVKMMAYLQYTAKRRYFWSNCYNSTKPPFGLTSAEVAVISHLFPSMSNSVLWYKLTSSRRKCDFIISWCQHLPCGGLGCIPDMNLGLTSASSEENIVIPKSQQKHDEICNWNVMISESHCSWSVDPKENQAFSCAISERISICSYSF